MRKKIMDEYEMIAHAIPMKDTESRCPMCEASAHLDEDGEMVGCPHFVGNYHPQYDPISALPAEMAGASFGTQMPDGGVLFWCLDDLTKLMTASEIADVFGVTRDAVHKAIQAGRLPARQSASTWLIRREDAIRLWGHTAKLAAICIVATAAVWALMA